MAREPGFFTEFLRMLGQPEQVREFVGTKDGEKCLCDLMKEMLTEEDSKLNSKGELPLNAKWFVKIVNDFAESQDKDVAHILITAFHNARTLINSDYVAKHPNGISPEDFVSAVQDQPHLDVARVASRSLEYAREEIYYGDTIQLENKHIILELVDKPDLFCSFLYAGSEKTQKNQPECSGQQLILSSFENFIVTEAGKLVGNGSSTHAMNRFVDGIFRLKSSGREDVACAWVQVCGQFSGLINRGLNSDMQINEKDECWPLSREQKRTIDSIRNRVRAVCPGSWPLL